jgi:outer membrane lipoprotein-sorting protein
MLVKARRILKFGVLLCLVLFACMQILNVRSPITIEQAAATSTSKARVYGYTYKSNGYTKLPYCTVSLQKPDGTTVQTSSNYNSYFAVSGNPMTLPNGSYTLTVSKSGYVTASKSFTLTEGYGASAKVKMVASGTSTIGITPFMPWY